MDGKGKGAKRTVLRLTVALGVYLCFSPLPAAEGFITFDHFNPIVRRKMNNLIRRVHKEQWTIGYVYMDNCPPEKRKNGKAIEEAITASLNAWLQPVRDLNTGEAVVEDFRYVEKLEIVKEDFKLYDLRIYFYCDFDKSYAGVLADEARPPALLMHRGTVVDDFAGVLLHEIGHAFGLLDTYIRPELTLEELRVSRGGLARTIGHQPASVMNGLNVPHPWPTRVSQDDANGIVWLYKFYHEDLALEDCIFPDYELEKDPDGCRPKYPLIFEIQHGREELATGVIDQDKNTDINAKDSDGVTALQYAIIKGYQQLVDKLLSHKDIEVNSDIDVNIKDGSGRTVLYRAIGQRSQNGVKVLLSHEGIDVNVQDGNGLTPLHYAVIERYWFAVEALLAHKDIDVNVQDGKGLTALHHAIMERDQKTVRWLLGHKDIDVGIKDKGGITPLRLAEQLKYNELADLISAHIEARRVRVKNSLATVWGALKVR